MDKKVKFLDPATIDETLAELAVLARRSNVRAVVVGGVAMMVHGSDRLTKDVDVAVVDEYLDGQLRPLRDLSFGGIVGVTPKGHEVDLIVREDAYRELYVAAVDAAYDAGLPLPVVTAPYLLALKMAAGRDKDELDVKFLIGTNDFQYDEARSIVRRHLGEYAARVLDSLRSEVEWKKSREGK